jgi:hypothetical protein
LCFLSPLKSCSRWILCRSVRLCPSPLFVCTESCQLGSLALPVIVVSRFAARCLRRFVHRLLLLCEFSVDLWSSDFLRRWSSFTAATIQSARPGRAARPVIFTAKVSVFLLGHFYSREVLISVLVLLPLSLCRDFLFHFLLPSSEEHPDPVEERCFLLSPAES